MVNTDSKRKYVVLVAESAGAEKVSIIRETQDNGDIYVHDRKTIYDPNKRYNRSTGKILIGKIPKGHTEMINTRPKKRALILSADQVAYVVKASRCHIGMLGSKDRRGRPALEDRNAKT